MGRKAQERIMEVPDRLRRLADLIETRSRAKTFNFDVAFNREFALP
jgi:acyl-[acyl-carrier-protein] desaturase